MASSFDRWEKDPFFSAAEEVQESADRMESTYRTWMHSKKEETSMWNSDELRRDLCTALGTAKWQLDEFQRAVSSSYIKSSTEDSRDRHREFIIAIEDQISKIEHSLYQSSVSEGKPPSPWVRLDEGECNELALFLSGSSVFGDNSNLKVNHSSDDKKQLGMSKDMIADCLKSSNHVIEKPYGHRRTASASADIGAWKIAIAEVNCPPDGSNSQLLRPPQKVPSFSGFLSSMEYAPKFKWPKNGVRKWKAMDITQDSDTAPLHSSQVTKGIHACYEKSKSCLDGCDECYDKQLYGWYGVIQRQLQRSQYQMQYGRPVQVLIWTVLLFCLIGERTERLLHCMHCKDLRNRHPAFYSRWQYVMAGRVLVAGYWCIFWRRFPGLVKNVGRVSKACRHALLCSTSNLCLSSLSPLIAQF